jgi:ribose transport system permease protein
MSGFWKDSLSRLASDYGMVLVLVALCTYYSFVTYGPQDPKGATAARQVAADAAGGLPSGSRVVVAVSTSGADVEMAKELAKLAARHGWSIVASVTGAPSDARAALARLDGKGEKVDAIICTRATRNWAVFDDVPARFPRVGMPRFLTPRVYDGPAFLTRQNLLNVAGQIAIIAVIAVGMTMVIITAGIDLSVGSLVALSAISAALLIRRFGGAEASAPSMVLCCMAAMGFCAFVGLFNGTMVTVFSTPPFIVTLATMLIASGMAYRLSQGQSVYDMPDTFMWLGRGETFGVPNAVLLSGILYLLAHVVMARMTLGRYIYAIGGNPEAARLSGVPVRRVLLLVYAVSGALAGLGGIIQTSRLKSAAPNYGETYELTVIAAVVVGGTSLAGGEGRVLGTLIGALIIAVIQNGMNLTGISPFNQKIVLGSVILAAVLIDTAKRGGWQRLRLGYLRMRNLQRRP